MNPLFKFHNFVLGITTILVFYLWGLLIDFTNVNQNLKLPIAALISVGTYQLILLLLKYFILKIRVIKKWIFGPYYLEGTWVGFFIGKSNEERFFIEIIEQDFESTIIRGKGFYKNDNYFGKWCSENVNINVKKGSLSYIYETDTVENSFINPGMANFSFDRKNISKGPFRLSGTSSDLYNPKKLKSVEEKISDKPDGVNVKTALEKAKKIFEDNKNIMAI